MLWYSLSHAMFANSWYSSYWAGLRVVVVAGWWCHLSNDLGFRSSRPKKISISARIIGVGQPGREEGSIFLCLSLPSSSSSPSPCVLSSFSSYETNQLPPVTVDPSTAAAMSSDVPGTCHSLTSFLFSSSFFCLYQSIMLKPKGILASLYQSKNFSVCVYVCCRVLRGAADEPSGARERTAAGRRRAASCYQRADPWWYVQRCKLDLMIKFWPQKNRFCPMFCWTLLRFRFM